MNEALGRSVAQLPVLVVGEALPVGGRRIGLEGECVVVGLAKSDALEL